MDKLIFAHSIGRIRALETKLLDKIKIDRMIESSSPKEALKILEETEYGKYLTNLNNIEDYEEVLKNALRDLYDFMYKLSPEKLLIHIFQLKYDYHNIKVILKGKALQKKLDYLFIPFGTENVNKLIEITELENLNDYNKNKEYFNNEVMLKGILEAKADFQEKKDPQKIDVILDNYMYKDMLLKSEKLQDDFLIEYVKMNIDITNVKTLLRVKKQNKSKKFLQEVLIGGGKINKDLIVSSLNESEDNIIKNLSKVEYEKVFKEGLEEYINNKDVSKFEKVADNFIMDYVKKGKYTSFGIEPLIGYLIAKETEIKIIRIIMVGKINKISPDIIRERLGDMYV
ncbi:V-type sodium ATPase subunit C [Clostridium acetireducens DSM 10703]|jgi:V/A-type H+-transporting ATPase subunit C|uniref:V-type sodium ATPase subunit C n=1 Tax=Clostridium acetireducens DSM 10703 TaxID=1121290 RepID=A0A1E8EYH7_9CLOT|nr:V-type ATP synthase subunit C [Clostridium acetireducens]OFI05585.1 V-type sodium ATPase subunit C [Clostridium acetireducens DSM 10703]